MDQLKRKPSKSFYTSLQGSVFLGRPVVVQHIYHYKAEEYSFQLRQRAFFKFSRKYLVRQNHSGWEKKAGNQLADVSKTFCLQNHYIIFIFSGNCFVKLGSFHMSQMISCISQFHLQHPFRGNIRINTDYPSSFSSK